MKNLNWDIEVGDTWRSHGEREFPAEGKGFIAFLESVIPPFTLEGLNQLVLATIEEILWWQFFVNPLSLEARRTSMQLSVFLIANRTYCNWPWIKWFSTIPNIRDLPASHHLPSSTWLVSRHEEWKGNTWDHLLHNLRIKNSSKINNWNNTSS